MNDLMGPWIRRFLVEYVMGERNFKKYAPPPVCYLEKTEMKAKALARCEAPLVQSAKRQSREKGLMSFLRTV